MPLAAAHFWYYAGWADKLEYAFPGRVAKPLGVAAQIIPWNFPLLMLAWKIAPALAAGNTVVLKPASTTPLSRAAVRRRLPPGRPAAGRRQHHHRARARSGWRWSPIRTSTRSPSPARPRSASGSPRASPGTDKALTLELGGKAANIVFDDAPLDQAIEGIVNGIYFNQGEVCCAGSRLLVQESIVEPLIEKLKDRLSTIRVGDPLDKNTDVGAINSKSQLEKITELVAAGVAEGAEMYQPACDLPDRGYFFRPTLFTNVAQSHRIAREEIFGPVLSVLTFRTPGRGGREGQQHGLRPVGRRLDRQGLPHPRDGRSGCAPASSGRTRSTGSTRPRRSVATRNRASGARAACTACTPTSGSRTADGDARPQAVTPARTATARAAATRAQNGRGRVAARVEVRKTYKLYIGGAFPRTESGRSYVVAGADGTPLANACRASRKDLRDAVRAARRAFPGWAAKTAMNRGQVLYRVAELMEGRREQFATEVEAAEGLRPAAARARRRPGHRPLGLVRRLGRQDRPGPGLVQPGRGAVLQLHDPRADRRRRRRRAGDVVAARARQPARAAARHRQRGRADRQRDDGRCPP